MSSKVSSKALDHKMILTIHGILRMGVNINFDSRARFQALVFSLRASTCVSDQIT